jgi:hypothetical protein
MLRAAARLATGRNMLQAFIELFHGGPFVGLDRSQYDINACRASGLRRLQHGVSSPDAGGGTKEDLRAAACHVTSLFAQSRKNGISIRSARVHD